MLRLHVLTEEERRYGNRGLTYTFAPNGENHVRNQQVGNAECRETFSVEELGQIQANVLAAGYQAEYLDLGQHLPAQYGTYPAGVLVIRNALQIFHLTATQSFDEVTGLTYDRQALMYGQVRNKKARHNLIVGDFDQEPVYEEGKGTVVNFTHTPCLHHLRTYLPTLVGEKGRGLIAEANDYYDVTQCGIGYHGDKERTMVIGLRIGASFPLCYYWYHQSKRISPRIDLTLRSGDMYIMSEKAVGFDSGKRVIPTLRHAAGCPKYIE